MPHEISDSEDRYKATTLRYGWGWLMTPLCAYQNYYLVHHLYPRTPFFNNIRVWRHIQKEVERERDLAIQRDWAIQPQIRRAGSPGAL